MRINGDNWNIHLLSNSVFNKKLGKEYSAMCMYNDTERDIFFKTEDMSLDTVIHECTHAYYSYLPIYKNTSKGNTEEFVCDLMAAKLFDLVWASLLVWVLLRLYSLRIKFPSSVGRVAHK